MIGHKRVPSREGGVEVVVWELAVRMAALGHQVDCYNRREPGAPASPEICEGVRLIDVPAPGRTSLNAFVYAALAVIRAASRGYDVIHIHAAGPGAMAFLPRLLGIPVVVTIHGLDWRREKWGGLARRYLISAERTAVRCADAVIVLCESHRRYMRERYGREAVRIPNGVTAVQNRSPREIERRWGLRGGDYILFVGRLVPEKRVQDLIRAYGGMRTPKRLVIAGRIAGAYAREIARMAREDERIVMVDFVSGEVLSELLCNCALYVLPSSVEGMALSLLEAMSCGVRCLVSDIPENVEAGAGFVKAFEQGDADALRTQMCAWLAEPWTREKASRQARSVRERHSWDAMVIRTLEVYEEAVRRRTAPS